MSGSNGTNGTSGSNGTPARQKKRRPPWKDEPRCGAYGGLTQSGKPCNRRAAPGGGVCGLHAVVAARGDAIRKAYLVALAKTGTIGTASEAAGIDRTMPSNWRRDISWFADAELVAMDAFRDRLEAKAIELAVEGWVEPVVRQEEVVTLDDRGRVKERKKTWKEVAGVRKHSERLIELLLKGHLPEKYKDAAGVNVQFNLFDACRLFEERRLGSAEVLEG